MSIDTRVKCSRTLYRARLLLAFIHAKRNGVLNGNMTHSFLEVRGNHRPLVMNLDIAIFIFQELLCNPK